MSRPKGYKHSEETKRKMSLKATGNKAWSGLRHSLESKVKMKGARPYRFQKGLDPWNKGKKFAPLSVDMRIKAGEKNKGANNPNWRGGISPIGHLIRRSLEYKLWRESVFKRDNWTCIWCGRRSGCGEKVYLHADHIKPFAHYPELRFCIDNGRTLCIDCHKTTDTFAGRSLKINKKTNGHN